MARIPRCQQVRPQVVQYYHTLSRCVRKMKLTNDGARKDYMLVWLKSLHEVFAVEVCRYALMGNHFHLIVRVNAPMAEAWSSHEVAVRWSKLHPPREGSYRALAGDALNAWRAEKAQDAAFVSKARLALCSLSKFMKDFKQRVAESFNREDHASGAFWEARYACVPLDNEASLLACMTYVDLNPHVAGKCGKPEEDPYVSLHESVRSREQVRRERQAVGLTASAANEEERHRHGERTFGDQTDSAGATEVIPDAEKHVWTVPVGRTDRHARRSILPHVRLEDYLRLVDFAARRFRDGKVQLDGATAVILERVQLGADDWLAQLGRWMGESAASG